MKFNEYLREIMEKRGVKQLALAQAIGIRQSNISHWLKEKTEPSFNALRLLSEYFGVSPNYWFNGVGAE